MTGKAASNTRNAAAPSIDAEGRDEAQVDAFIARNKDALNASLIRSRAEVAKGIVSTRAISDVIADGRRRHGKAI